MSASGKPIRVLHVDDEPDFAETAAELLERQDERFTVEVATGAEEALDHLSRTAVDCIVSDFEMPGSDGIEFLEAVRSKYPRLPFILFTGRGSEDIASEAISEGVTDYLQKKSGTEQFELLANRITNTVSQSRAERELAQQRQRFERLFERLTQPTVEIEYEGETPIVRDLNPAFEETFGYGPAEILGEPLDDYIVPEGDEDEASELNSRLRTGGQVDTQEVNRLTADGERQFLLQTAIYEHGARGFGIYTDISEQKDREKDLERQNIRLAGLFENLPEPTFAYAFRDGVPEVQEINTAFTEVFGYEATDAIGASIDDLIVPSDRQSEAERIDQQVRAGEAVDQVIHREAKDETRTFRFRNISLPGDPEIDGYAIYADITDQRDRERTLETLHTAATEIQTCEDVTAACQRTVDAAEEVLDFEMCSVLLYQNGYLEPVATSSGAPADGVRRVTDDQGLAGKTYRSKESHIVDEIKPDDETDPARASYRSGMSVPVGEVGVFQAASSEVSGFDETDVEFAELLVSHTAGAIDRIRYAEELQDSRARLQHQNERLERFVNLISHDLRNPLNVAEGRLALARTDTDSEDLEAVAAAHGRIDTLIDGLVTLAQEGRPVEEFESVDMSSLVTGCWEAVHSEDGQLTVETETTVRAEPDRLKRLIENLLRNAIDHGGPDVRVTIGDLPDGFYVADDGPGIPAKDRDSVFEYGYSSAENGTGFGLAIVQEVADAHDWDITLTNSEAEGARFEFHGVDRGNSNEDSGESRP